MVGIHWLLREIYLLLARCLRSFHGRLNASLTRELLDKQSIFWYI